MQFSVRVDNTRMAALGGAFSAPLRWSQDLNIGDQKHQHADSLAWEARGFFPASKSQQSCFVRESPCPARRRSTGSTDERPYVTGICACSTVTLGGRGWLCRDKPSALKLLPVSHVKGGRRAPKWATATGSHCKMSTLPFHPHQIDCITYRNVGPRINTEALFQHRRCWARSPSCTRAPVLSCWAPRRATTRRIQPADKCARSPGLQHLYLVSIWN